MQNWFADNDSTKFAALRDAVSESQANLGLDSDLDAASLFTYLTELNGRVSQRDVEPLLGYLVLFAPVTVFAYIMQKLRYYIAEKQWACVQKGGYLLDLWLAYRNDFCDVEYKEVVNMARQLPADCEKIPFFPQDKRNTTSDQLALHWKLSSGVVYSRLNQILRAPYVC